MEQTGTSEEVINGQAVYSAWWEMYSTGKQQPSQVISSMIVEPGDSITASVQYISSGTHAGEFYLSIVDHSRPNDSFNIYASSEEYQSPVAQRSTAEWTVEAPQVSGQIASLANFGSVTFTNASEVINGASGPINKLSWQVQALNIWLRQGRLRYDVGSDQFRIGLYGDLRLVCRGRGGSERERPGRHNIRGCRWNNSSVE